MSDQTDRPDPAPPWEPAQPPPWEVVVAAGAELGERPVWNNFSMLAAKQSK